MKKQFYLAICHIFVAAAIVLLGGCATLDDAKSEKGEGGAGTIKTYNANFDELWESVVQIVQDANLNIVESDKEKGELLAEGPGSLFSYGEKVAIYVEKAGSDDSKTKIEIISKRALATNITATNWETKIFEKLDSLFTLSDT